MRAVVVWDRPAHPLYFAPTSRKVLFSCFSFSYFVSAAAVKTGAEVGLCGRATIIIVPDLSFLGIGLIARFVS
jgi:hypothetical protein